MSDTAALEPKSKESSRLNRLVRMLQNTLRNYPLARLRRGRGVFGASLGDNTWIHIRWSGDLSASDMRDLLALFATWLAVDPEGLLGNSADETNGSSAMGTEQRYLSSGQRVSHMTRSNEE